MNFQFAELAQRPVDARGIELRTAHFSSRSLKKQSKQALLRCAIQMIDLTTLEGADTERKVLALCHKTMVPLSPSTAADIQRLAPSFVAVPPVAAVCVYPSLVRAAKQCLQGTGVKVASVATAFPAGQLPLELRLAEVRYAVSEGADEIDMVLQRGKFLAGHYEQVADEIRQFKDACGPHVHLKVILETGELGSYDRIRFASFIAMEAGADFIKTSTGKLPQAASLQVTLVMLQAILDFYLKTGKKIGMKPAGGIRTAKQALQYLVMVKETLGEAWMTPDLFRLGASTLLNDLLRQVIKEELGFYYYEDGLSRE